MAKRNYYGTNQKSGGLGKILGACDVLPPGPSLKPPLASTRVLVKILAEYLSSKLLR